MEGGRMQTGMGCIALVIGLLGAVGPSAIDMYLPALPQVAAGALTSEPR
jgi:DHA1 family bicyclomycin/chloramphenicol resistance-like MFS transporter